MKEVDAVKEWFGFGVVKMKKAKNSSGLKIPKSSGGSGGGKGISGVAGSMKRAAMKSPEVMVKVTGGGKGVKEAKKHLDYISRDGEVKLETQDGEILEGKEAIEDLRDEWRSGGMPEEGRNREVFNVVLSMPEGTPRDAVLNAARDFAAQEFHGHKYVLAEHRDEDHPHVHIAVVARGEDGTKLNPRKADLFNWRTEFAAKLRAEGVDANATRRTQRFSTNKKGEKQAIRQIREESKGNFKHGRKKVERKPPLVDSFEKKEISSEVASNRAKIDKTAATAYQTIAGELFRQGDIKGAALLDQFAAKNMPVDIKSSIAKPVDKPVDDLTQVKKKRSR